jgi:hypothetical protein
MYLIFFMVMKTLNLQLEIIRFVHHVHNTLYVSVD